MQRIVDSRERDPDAAFQRFVVQALGGDVAIVAVEQQTAKCKPLAGRTQTRLAQMPNSFSVWSQSIHGVPKYSERTAVLQLKFITYKVFLNYLKYREAIGPGSRLAARLVSRWH